MRILILVSLLSSVSSKLASARSSVVPESLDVQIIEDVQPDECAARLRDGDMVWVDYTGWLPDGTVFGTSRAWKPEGSEPSEPHGPFVLGEGEVIPGVDRGLVGMCLGGQRTLRVPPHLAYGESGTPDIPPNSTLKLQYEITRVHPKFRVTIERSSDLCLEAAGEGSEVTVSYSGYYGVIESGASRSGSVEWVPLSGKPLWPFVLTQTRKTKDAVIIIDGLYQA